VDWLSHPIVITTYAAALSALVAAIRAVARLFSRVGDVERGIDQLNENVSGLSTDLRAHMAEEGDNINRLELLIRSIRPPKD
jgi:ABC-type transporter Mla subunit MlaD